jgi:hypothetical protein
MSPMKHLHISRVVFAVICPSAPRKGKRRRRLNRAGNDARASCAFEVLANEATPPFGIAFSLDAKFENERQLRRLSATRPTRETQKATYF